MHVICAALKSIVRSPRLPAPPPPPPAMQCRQSLNTPNTLDMHCAQCLPPVFSIFPSQFIGPVRLRRVCSLCRNNSKKVAKGYRFGRVFELRCSCKISILDFVLYLVRLCAFHFSSFSICIVHQQLRWRWSCHSRCGLHWAASAVFALLVLQFQARAGHRVLLAGRAHVFAKMHFHTPHKPRQPALPGQASHVHRACMHWTMHSPAHRGITRCQCPAQLQVQS